MNYEETDHYSHRCTYYIFAICNYWRLAIQILRLSISNSRAYRTDENAPGACILIPVPVGFDLIMVILTASGDVRF
ncbi:hypothetical protein GCM10028868_12950 [Virgibacillus kimchii]